MGDLARKLIPLRVNMKKMVWVGGRGDSNADDLVALGRLVERTIRKEIVDDS